MIDPINHRIDQILAKKVSRCPIILNQVETCLFAILIVTMQDDKVVIDILAHPTVNNAQVLAADPAILIDASRLQRIKQQMIQMIGCRQTVVDVKRRRPTRQPWIQLDPIHHAIEPRARRGGIAVVVADPFRDICHPCIRITIFVFKAKILSHTKTDMINAIKHCIDSIQAKHFCRGAIILHKVIAGLTPVLVISMPIHKKGITPCIAANPLVQPDHLLAAQTRVVIICGARCAELLNPLQDQAIEIIRGLGSTTTIGPGDGGLKPGVSDDGLHNPIEPGATAGEIHLQGGQPPRHIG